MQRTSPGGGVSPGFPPTPILSSRAAGRRQRRRIRGCPRAGAAQETIWRLTREAGGCINYAYGTPKWKFVVREERYALMSARTDLCGGIGPLVSLPRPADRADGER
jgi:hypothetical protein